MFWGIYTNNRQTGPSLYISWKIFNDSVTCLGIHFPYHYISKDLNEKGVKINLKKKKKYFFLNDLSENEVLSGPFVKLPSILYA